MKKITQKPKEATLEQKIDEAIDSGKYLVMITEKHGDRLDHAFFTNDFPRNKVFPALEKIAGFIKTDILEEKS